MDRRFTDRRLANFWRRVDASGDCWLWTGQVTVKGYGVIRYDGKWHKAHRLAFEWLVERIPEGLILDHLCRIPACVNPDHLQIVTPAENTRRGIAALMVRTRLRLSPALVREARQAVARGESIASVAADLGVHANTVYRAVRGQTWKRA